MNLHPFGDGRGLALCGGCERRDLISPPRQIVPLNMWHDLIECAPRNGMRRFQDLPRQQPGRHPPVGFYPCTRT